jgi:hypothetical protein
VLPAEHSREEGEVRGGRRIEGAGGQKARKAWRAFLDVVKFLEVASRVA